MFHCGVKSGSRINSHMAWRSTERMMNGFLSVPKDCSDRVYIKKIEW